MTGKPACSALRKSGAASPPDTGGRIMEGRGAELLAEVLAQVYACLILRPLHTTAGMGLYMELLYMMEALMLGEWFD